MAMLEERLALVWGPLVDGRLYPDTAPDDREFPLMIYQQVGGRDSWYVDGRMPSHRHARIQLYVWARSRRDANTLAMQAEKALSQSGLIAEPYGALTAVYDEDQKLYGTRQDFGIWHNDSQ